MSTLNEIFLTFNLSSSAVNELSKDAKEEAVGVGQHGQLKELSDETSDLFDEISDYVWYSEISNHQKIKLGFELFEMFPSYDHFLAPFYHAILDKEIVAQNEKDIIWKHFLKYLASENHYADPVGYVLWVEFFEDQETVTEAWEGLIRNCTDRKVLLQLLELAGPVPFDLKEPVYNSLLSDVKAHKYIFNSLLSSAYDAFGKIDKDKARNILSRLKISQETTNYKLLLEKLK